VATASVLRNPAEFGKRVAAARGYARMKKPMFAQAMGKSVPTVTRWEEGAIGSIGTTVRDREALAQSIIRATGCPPDWFDLGQLEPSTTARLAVLEEELAQLRDLVIPPDADDQDVRDAVTAAADVDRTSASTTPQSEEPSSGPANE
jgi:transcriptional regulator with XRE-family HTH domain